jgi:hypothetical protein
VKPSTIWPGILQRLSKQPSISASTIGVLWVTSSSFARCIWARIRFARISSSFRRSFSRRAAVTTRSVTSTMSRSFCRAVSGAPCFTSIAARSVAYSVA